MHFSGSQALIDCFKCEAMLSKIEDLGDLCPPGVRLKLARDVPQGDVRLGIVGRGQRLLASEFKIGMSHHHQWHVTFHGEQIPHLVVPPHPSDCLATR